MPKGLQALITVPRDPDAIEHVLEGLVALNAYLISRHNLPPLYETGVRYEREPVEYWRHAQIVLAEGWGDCEDLAAYRAAELRVYSGEPARIGIIRTGPRTLHAIVLRANGDTEDPSRKLGM